MKGDDTKVTEKEEALKDTEKRPPLKKREILPSKIKEPIEQVCFDTGVFALKVIKRIPMYLVVALAFIWGSIKKFGSIIKKLLLSIAHPFISLFDKI